MVLLVGAARAARGRRPRAACSCPAVSAWRVYYAAGIAFSALEARAWPTAQTFGAAVRRARAVVGARARAGGRRGAARASPHTRAPSGERPRGERETGRAALAAAPARLRGTDPGAGPAAQPGRARRVRAADGSPRLPRARLALRRLPVQGERPALRRPCVRLGGASDRVHAVREGPAADASAGRSSSSTCRSARSLSAALLYRAHRRRRLLLLGRPPRAARQSAAAATGRASRSPPGRSCSCSSRCPFVPAVAGLGAGRSATRSSRA